MNKFPTRSFSLALALVAGSVASAQFDMGGGASTSSSSGSWAEKLKMTSKAKIKLDFRNANIDLVLQMFQKTSGKTIIKDPNLTGPFTITSAGSVDLSTAFTILEKTLNLKGYDMTAESGMAVIKKRETRGGGGMGSIFGQGGGMPTGMSFPGMGGGDQPPLKLKFYPIKYANATQVARVVNEVFVSAGQTNSNPFQSMFGGGGMGFQGGGRGGRGGGFNPMSMLGGNRNQSSSNVRASADDFSNSVIVNAPDKEQLEVERVIKQIDKETDQPQKTMVYKLEFATATEIAPTIQNVLTNNAPRGRGGTTSSGANIGDRFQQAARFGSTQAAFGTVASDTRTNSLVITATDESQLIVAQVIKDIDKPVEFQNTTFVFPLNNAKADDVANLLNQSFGQRQGAGRTNRNTTPTQQRTNTNNAQRANNNAQRIGGTIEDNQMFVDMEDPNATSGDLMTNVFAQGGGFFGQFGGGGGARTNAQTQNQTQTGRDANGRLVPIRDLTGQITAIPDPNTNSIIVVGNPDSAALIKQILEQLDRIPEQVMIETIIVEANLDSTNKLGVEWNYTSTGQFGTPGQTGTVGTDFNQAKANPALQGFRYTLGGANLTAFMNAIQTDTKFQILSTPRIFTSNNTQAQINISQSIPYVTNSRIDANGNTIFNYAFLDVGIVLTVTPRITANGYVTMDVNQTANDLQGYTTFDAPIVNQREADTVVSVKNGETIILGGIIRNSVSTTSNKVPVLGDIPLLGQLFRTNSKISNKTELLVLLTPRIVKDEDEARQLRLDQTKKLSQLNQDALGKAIPPESTKTEVKEPVKAPVKDQKKSGGN
ncbi:MAG: secretin N-terminal domain-containing protein [Armatimonadota bacterium]